MKTLLTSLFLISQTIVLCAQHYEHPYVEMQSNMNQRIISIEIGDTTKLAFLTCNMTMNYYDYYFPVSGSSNAMYLENVKTGDKHEYIGQDGTSSKSNMKRLPYNTCDTTMLYFQKIPPSVKNLHLISGSKNNSWDFKGIDLNRIDTDRSERISGYFCYYNETKKISTSFFFSETYTIQYYAKILDYDREQGVNVEVVDAKIIDPSFASYNYLKYKSNIANYARQKLKKTNYISLFAPSIVIWD